MQRKILVFDTNLKAERDYWLDKLSAMQERSGLVLDFERPDELSGAHGQIEIEIAPDLYTRILKLTKQAPFLLYVVLLSALKICLYKYTGNELIVVGSPAQKKTQDPHPAPNVLPIVDQLEPYLSFQQLLLRIRETLLEAYKRQRYPFNHLIKELGLEDTRNRCPLFDVVMALRDIHGEIPALPNDLTIIFAIQDQCLRVTVVFKRQLISQRRVERFINHFITLLDAAIDHTHASIAELDVLS